MSENRIRLSTWTNEAVVEVLRGSREIIGLELNPYGVGDHGMHAQP